ncbi:hypothetical protein [Spirochaeta cellobiosiphila]|uniref:hypothetical protein n=1 Tax=Spirochaeta cellobiosiphila TaxID=504483 RepID=UPI00041F26E0|nr:hypothetical protein [Spirochaeta cellobiosiphila]
MSLTKVELLVNQLFDKAPAFPLTDEDRFVVLSDFHMGNGSKRDDFRLSSSIVYSALVDYYMPQGYTLILNGDIEELQKYRMDKIIKAWPQIYEAFDAYHNKGKLFKIHGNHDESLFFKIEGFNRYPIYNAIKYLYHDKELFFFHGHQLNQRYNKYNNMIEFLLRYLVKPLGIKNYSVAYNSHRQFSVEKNGYKWSVNKGIMSFIGHTHRPLFESLSGEDSIKFRIEHLCRHYHEYNEQQQQSVILEINHLKEELEQLLSQKKELSHRLYSENVIVPCLFNSGTAVGKRGVTAIEYDKGRLNLVHWYDNHLKKRFSISPNPSEEVTENTFRTVLRTDKIEYILNKIQLLG